MKRVVFGVFLAVFSLAFLQAPSQAQIDDHLKCYKIKDPLRLQGVVDIFTPQFGLEKGCRIARAELFCVPATKRVLKAIDLSTSPPSPIDPLPIFGPPAPGDRICYRIKCETAAPPRLEVSDQFGHRRVEIEKPELLCTPAVKGPPPRPCGRTSADEECNGFCPTGLTCQDIPGANKCDCLPPPPPTCERSPFPQCGGPCPTGQECKPDPNGLAECRCQTPPPPVCERSSFPECGGTCPEGSKCVPSTVAGVCRCEGPPPTCEQGPYPTCGGPCPAPLVCGPDPSGVAECRCQTPPPPVCERSPFPECGGSCPPGSNCVPSAVTGVCRCEGPPPTCEQGPFPQCGGPCPAPLVCGPDPSGVAECRCQTPPPPVCERSPFPECGGSCPPGSKCVPDTVTNACRCEGPPPTCEQGPFPQCGGPCPAPLVCGPDPSGVAECRCQTPPPPTCAGSPFPTCGGPCPVGTVCRADASGECKCVIISDNSSNNGVRKRIRK